MTTSSNSALQYDWGSCLLYFHPVRPGVVAIHALVVLAFLITFPVFGFSDDLLLRQGVPPLDETDDGALSRARRAHDCGNFASLNTQVKLI